MTILALDTTTEWGSVAIRRDGETVWAAALHSPEGFSQTIFRAIEDALQGGGVALAEVDCFAAASGPGSFTGVRVGLAAVKGLAEANEKAAAGISNLRALSWHGRGELRAAVLDARRGDVYGAVYDAKLKLVLPEMVLPWAAWLERLGEGEFGFVSQKGGPCEAAGKPYTEAPRGLALAIACCAEMDGPEGWQDPAALDANYVRQADAQLFWKDV